MNLRALITRYASMHRYAGVDTAMIDYLSVKILMQLP